MQNSQIRLEELFEAYFSCRQNKRYTINAQRFEIDYERNLITLCNEINRQNYKPGKSIAFIIDKPVKREIFAADFRDRIVHHLVINKLNPLFEKIFIYDSYACRIGKGTHFGIKRMDGFIRKCSQNYTKDCYILKLDIRAFFMNIDRNILFSYLQDFIHSYYFQADRALTLLLCKRMIFNEPTKNCIIRGDRNNWQGLPTDKSLFHAKPDCGLPIGNLTSQIFANFYMNAFDHFVKHDLGLRFYGRYVDDMVLVHESKSYLEKVLPKMVSFLDSKLKLRLHPKKIHFEHYSTGVEFLGTIIMPYRIKIAGRTKGNFYRAIEEQNRVCKNHRPSKEESEHFLCIINTYLGLMKHYRTYRLRKKMLLTYLSIWWWDKYYSSGGYAKLVAKQNSVKS